MLQNSETLEFPSPNLLSGQNDCLNFRIAPRRTIGPAQEPVRRGVTHDLFESASQSATIRQRPDAMASWRMFLPHQPVPISAVRWLRPEDCAKMNGA
jgi:hypothetical protein